MVAEPEEGMTPRCESCQFWQSLGTFNRDGYSKTIGKCRRSPPQVYQSRGFAGGYESVWPETNSHDVCGEWQMKKEPPK